MSNKTVFVVSTGRTGTGFLGRELNALRDVVAFHEPDPDMIKEGKRYLRWKHRTFRHTRLRNFFPFDLYYRLKFKWDRTLKAPSEPDKIYLEANSKLVPVLPVVKKAFPECTLIQIVRHPGSFVRSGLSKGWFLHASRGQLPLLPTYYGEMSFDEWTQLSPIQRANWFWLRCNILIDRENPDLCLKHESIFEAPHEGFKRLLGALDLNPPNPESLLENKVNPSFDLGIPPYDQWKREWKDQISESVNWFNKRFQE